MDVAQQRLLACGNPLHCFSLSCDKNWQGLLYIYIYTQAHTIEATECSKHLPTLSFCSPKHFPRNYDLTSISLMELCICMIVAQDGIFTLQFQGGSNE